MPVSDAFAAAMPFACDRIPAKVSADRPVSATMRPDAIGSPWRALFVIEGADVVVTRLGNRREIYR
jgi:hypothetical protein